MSRPSNIPTINQPNAHSPLLATQLTAELLSRHSLPVSQQWLNTFLSTVRLPPPPLPVLTSTAHFRLLNSDFTESLSSTQQLQQTQRSHVFPTDISDVLIKSQTLTATIPVQVLSIEDTGTSKWSQLETIERVERGEEIRGREVIRTIPIMNEDDAENDSTNANHNLTANMSTSTSNSNTTTASSSKRSSGPHKLLVQDASGTKTSAFEVSTIPKLFTTSTAASEDGGISIGCKLLIKPGTLVRRGVLMLSAENVVVLGGRVEGWDRGWRERRKERLKDAMGATGEGS